jgi:hypothetical protein
MQFNLISRANYINNLHSDEKKKLDLLLLFLHKHVVVQIVGRSQMIWIGIAGATWTSALLSVGYTLFRIGGTSRRTKRIEARSHAKARVRPNTADPTVKDRMVWSH